MKNIKILLLIILPLFLASPIIAQDNGGWERLIEVEEYLRSVVPEFYSEVYYNEETTNICLIDNASPTLSDHLTQLLILTEYVFILTDNNRQRGIIENYYEGDKGGILSCWNEFEFWTNKMKMERLYEIYLGMYRTDNGVRLEWQEVVRYFLFTEYSLYLEINQNI